MRFRLFVFGGLRLETDGEPVTGPPAQRRRVALLAVLAASDQQRIPREKALALLWPEQSTARARHLLSESLYVLRRHLGKSSIQSGRDDLILRSDVIWSDVAAFQDAIAAGSTEVASLYRGPFLDGFYLKHSPEFDAWAESLRDRFASQFGRAIESMAQINAAEGNALAAAEWWGRLADHDPFSSRIAGRYVNALENLGERARAIRFATAHIARLRTELGVNPDAEFQSLHARLQRSGARTSGAEPSPAPHANVEQEVFPAGFPSPVQASGEAVTAAPASRVRRTRLHRRATLAALCGVAVVTIFALRFHAEESLPSLGQIETMTFEPGVEIEPSLSPDGRYVAYAGGAPFRLYLRQQGSQPVRLVTPDSGPAQRRPRWSPDGRHIAYDAARRIFVIPALGGAPRQVVADGWSATWAPDGQRIAYALFDTIFTIDLRGGRPVPLARVREPAELAWSPDGRWIALTAGNDVWDGLIHVGNIAPSRILLLRTADGHQFEITDRSSMNVAPTWSPDSRQLLFISNRDGARDIYRVRLSADGHAEHGPDRITTGLGAHSMALAPTGDRIVYATYRGRVNIWSLPIPTGVPADVRDAHALTSGDQLIESISVSPSRRWIYFTSDRSGNSDIWRVPRGGGEPVQVTTDLADEFAPEESFDGAWLAYYSLRHGSRDLWVRPTGDGEAMRLTSDPEEEHQPHWSPDGMKLCYSQTNARTSQQSIRIIRREGNRWSAPVTLPGADGAPNRLLGCAGWLPDGRTLVVHDADRSMIALMPAEGGTARVIYQADSARGRPQPTWVRVEPRSGSIYFRDWSSIWELDPANPVPRQVARFDDPVRRSTRIEMDADGEHVYFSIGDPQSELFTASVSGLVTVRDRRL